MPPLPHKAPNRRRGRPRSEGPTPEYLKRQAEIVAVATEIFRAKGDATGTLQEVADTLGLQRASLYHYVHSKAHLLSLVCEQVLNAIIQAIEEVSGIEDPTERLVAAIRVHVTTIVEHQAVFTVFFDDRASLSDDDKARLRHLEARYVEAFTATVTAAIDAGVLPRTDPRQAALGLIGLASWPYKWFDPQRDDPRAYADVGLTLLLDPRRPPRRRRGRQPKKVALGIGRLETSIGTHLCGFYRGRDEFEGMVIPFLREGLRSGDKTLCVVDSQPPKKLLGSLKGDIDVTQPLATHQLEVLASSEAHLRGGRFQRDEMITWWDEQVGDALMQFPRVRVVGEMSWALRDAPGTEDLFAYEAEVNRFASKYPQVLFCLYDLDRVDGSMVVNAMKTHPRIVIDGTLVDSPCYSDPDEFLASWSTAG